jgi:dipeptidyl aminopeptidase/acylaminoacyl peptidase
MKVENYGQNNGQKNGRNDSQIKCNEKDAQVIKSLPLMPRKLLFGNPDRITTRISPDGRKISFIAPRNGVLNVWVGEAQRPQTARPVTDDVSRGIRTYFWAYTSRHILYMQDQNGDENWKIYSVDIESGKTLDLTDFEGVRAVISALSPKHPFEVIIGLNKRDPEYHDLYRLNIETGEMNLLIENREFSGFEIDDEYRVRLASKMTEDGGSEIFTSSSEGLWESYLKIEMEDTLTTGFAGFDKSNDSIYFIDSRGRNTAALYQLDLQTKESTLLAEDARSDLSGLMVHPTERNLQAVAFCYERMEWRIHDPSIKPDFDRLRSVDVGDMTVVSRSRDDRIWIAVYSGDDRPARYYYYDRESGQVAFLFTDNEKLQGQPLAKMNPAIIKSRDGLDLLSYYTLPKESDRNCDGLPDNGPLPMVLYVHGGPWARDHWGLSPIHQWLANRGYAVLSVNFRGSTGLGKGFINAGNLEWGRKMHDDLIDSVNWSIESGIADPRRIAIMGGSYGGYAALAGLTFTPKTFACAVDIVGPSNLITLLNTIPPYWKPEVEQFTKRVGDFRTEEGRRLLEERSPLNFVERIERPLLIGQGANDPRVKKNESDQIVRAMQDKGLPVTYVLYHDEGHGFARPENRLSFYAIAEAFLARYLGGQFQPIGQDFAGASLTVSAGTEDVPGLVAALAEKSKSTTRQ